MLDSQAGRCQVGRQKKRKGKRRRQKKEKGKEIGKGTGIPVRRVVIDILFPNVGRISGVLQRRAYTYLIRMHECMIFGCTKSGEREIQRNPLPLLLLSIQVGRQPNVFISRRNNLGALNAFYYRLLKITYIKYCIV